MSDIKWVFPSNEGGRETGLHDAGVETFKGNFTHFLARELIQNSFDAREDLDKPVCVKFRLENLPRSEVPDMDALTDAMEKCAKFWNDQPKALKFFEDGAQLSQSQEIPTLVVGDYNTKGVQGSDKDRKKDWYNLIRCAGSSAKGAGAGGSFGIGKNAPFAASRLRTVLYSTLNNDDEHIFQGVSTLASFDLPDGKTAQATGYLGLDDTSSVRSKSLIPKRFVRNERGADIIVLGYAGGDSWQKDLLYSVLDNFWLAIHSGQLEVQVGSTKVDKENLEKLLAQFGDEEDFSGHLYYRAYTQGIHTVGNLKHLGEVDVYLLADEDELPKKVSLMRNTGMTIERRRFRSLKPYCGVFVCSNGAGSDKLRQMEPPKHDTWDPDHPDKGANKAIETEYVGFIRDCIRALTPVDDSTVIPVPELHRYLPDDDDSPEEPFDQGGDIGTTESAEARREPQTITGHVIKPNQKAMQPDHSKPGDGDDETDSPEGEGGGAGPVDNSNNGSDGPGGGSGGDGDGKGSTTTGSGGGLASKPAIPISARSYCTDIKAGSYVLTVKRDGSSQRKSLLAVYAVGDDQKTPAPIKSVRTETGKELPVDANGVIGPVQIPANKSIRLHVVLQEPARLSMEVAAYEAA